MSESIEAAAASDADAVLFELEDAVPVGEKAAARDNVINALGDLDWSDKVISVRVNALDSPFTFQDVIGLLEAPSAPRIDLLFLPKAGTPADVYAFEVLISQVERSVGRDQPVGIDLMIESAQGLANVNQIAHASDRIESLQFGSFDFAASTQMRSVGAGAPHPDFAVLADDGERHRADPFQYPIGQLVVASRAAGLRPIDGPSVRDLFDPDGDLDGFRQAAIRGRVLGCEGKQVGTNAQALIANDVYSPTEDEVGSARQIVAAAEATAGDLVRSLDGRYLDDATIAAATDVVIRADAIAGRQG